MDFPSHRLNPMQRIVWLIDRLAGILSKNRWAKEFLYRLISNSRVLKNVLSSSSQEVEPAAVQLSDFSKISATGSIPRVSIVLTVHNNIDAVKRCLESVRLARIPNWADLVVVDDFSDEETRVWLKKQTGLTLISNPANLGYTRSVNIGISVFPENDVVILNSDTVVPDLWLGDLRAIAYSEPNIGTVTPLTDRPGAFGIVDERTNRLLSSASLHQLRESLTELSLLGSGKLIRVPTGNGFCMFIKRATLNTVGLFDESLFPIGYGEENFFCMSASEAGWKSVVTDRVVVHHSGSGSFGARSSELKKSGVAIVKSRFPEYEVQLRVFQTQFFIKKRNISAVNDAYRRRILLVNPIISGGTKLTNDLLARSWVEMGCEVFQLTYRPNDDVLLEILSPNETKVINFGPISRHQPMSQTDETFDALVAEIALSYSISRVHFAHAMWQSSTSSKVLHEMGRVISFFAHDFETLCPSIYLLDDQNNFCGGTCTGGKDPCLPTFGSSLELPVLKNYGVLAWRRQKTRFLDYCDYIFAASEFTRTTLIRNVPGVKEKVVVLEHPARQSPSKLFAPSRPGAELSVLIIGSIGPLKGLPLLRELGSLAAKNGVKLCLLGSTSDGLPIRGVEMLGRFDHNELSEKIKGRKFSLGIHLGTMPETFSRTLDELWSFGLPVFGPSLGAVGERIARTGAGTLFHPKVTARDLLHQILDYQKDVESQIAMSNLALAEIGPRSSQDYRLSWASEIIEPGA